MAANSTVSSKGGLEQEREPMQLRRVLQYLLGYLKVVRVPFSISLLLLLLVAGLTAAKAWIIQPVVDGFIRGEATQRALLIMCFLVAGIFVLQAALNCIYAIVARVASANVVRLIRSDLHSHLTRQSLGYFSAKQTADLASRVVNDVATFEQAAVNSLQSLARDLATLVLLLVVVMLKDWRLAATCLAIAATTGVVLRGMGSRVEQLGREVQRMIGQINRRLLEMIGGIELLLGFGLGKQWERRFEDVNQELYGTQIKATKATSFAVLIVAVFVGLGVAGILLVTGRATLTGRITPGEFGTFLAAMYLMQAPAVDLGSSLAKVIKGSAAAGRALELLEDPPAIRDPENPMHLGGDLVDLEFNNVSFRYAERAPAVKALSFSVPPGELVVMVGDSGAGKSTIAKLLLRFYDPDEGQVKIGGIDLRDLNRDELYRHVSYVSQDIYLFDGTIDFNLKIGRPDASAEELSKAVRIACLDDLMAQLPERGETNVGERGVRLSGGQRQRIAIARAVLTEADLLVLDEATSALDMELEQRILQNLVDAEPRRTIFAVTHRLTLAGIADRVLVLKGGKLVEEGRAATLAATQGEFARLQGAAQARLVRNR